MKIAKKRARTRNGRALQGQCGFVLLEVLIAGVVGAIALLGLALMFATGQSMVVGQGSERVELYLAEQKLEGYRASGFPGVTGLQTETITGGEAGTEKFNRVTCAYYVDKNTLLPPGGVTPPNPCAAGAATTAVRVTVTVTQGAISVLVATRVANAPDPVTVETVLVNPS